MAIRFPTPAIVLALAVLLLGCGPSPSPVPGPPPAPAERTRARAARDAPAPDPEAARRLVLEAYVEIDTLIGAREPIGRFRHMGGASATGLLPETDLCHVYFSLADGTWCYRAQYGEPFRTRRVDAFAHPMAARADALLERAPGVPYDSIRDLAFLDEYVETESLACASFFVRELLVDLEDARFETFVDPPTGLVADGMACEDGEGRWALYEPAEAPAAYRLWDRAPLGDHDVAVILRHGDEVAWFEVYRIRTGSPVLVTAVELWPPG